MANIATLLPPIQPGERRGGRQAGTPNRATRALKKAILNAAAKSTNCPEDDKTLEGYCTYLANAHPPVFANLMGRLIPVQAKVKVGSGSIENLNINMSLSDMVSKFEMKIKSGYRPPAPPVMVIDNEADNNDDEED